MREADKKVLLRVRRGMVFMKAILGLGLTATGILLTGWEAEKYQKGQKLYAFVEASCVIRETETETVCEDIIRTRQDPGLPEKQQKENVYEEEKPDTSQIDQIDFGALQEINPDVTAWIEIPGTKVSYPVLFRYGDTNYYLTHLMDGREGKQGAIHIDGSGPDGIESQNVLIYGHNLMDSSMFSSLHSYKRESFYRNYPYIYLHMPDGTKRQYRIAACMVTEGIETEWYRYAFEDDADAQAYYDLFQQKSLYDTKTKLDAEEGRQTILLSTCYRRQCRRMILAVRES